MISSALSRAREDAGRIYHQIERRSQTFRTYHSSQSSDPLYGSSQRGTQSHGETRGHLCVEEPTDWCTGTVVVWKSSRKVRICVDLTKLNKNVSRKHHLPTVEQTLAQITSAQISSKLDENSGFWTDHIAKLIGTSNPRSLHHLDLLFQPTSIRDNEHQSTSNKNVCHST